MHTYNIQTEQAAITYLEEYIYVHICRFVWNVYKVMKEIGHEFEIQQGKVH